MLYFQWPQFNIDLATRILVWVTPENEYPDKYIERKYQEEPSEKIN